MNSEVYLLKHQEEKIRSAAEIIFGKNCTIAQKYAEKLAHSGIERGLLGPREVPRLWDRHILNCAIIHQCMSEGSSVIDIGSGAGLPGITLAIARPDLKVFLVEPLKRRTIWLEEIVKDLCLTNVEVFRCRAEEVNKRLSADIVTARAVTSLEKLIRISFPLLRTPEENIAHDSAKDATEASQPKMVAIKGLSVTEELRSAQNILNKKKLRANIRILGEDILTVPTRVVEILNKPLHH